MGLSHEHIFQKLIRILYENKIKLYIYNYYYTSITFNTIEHLNFCSNMKSNTCCIYFAHFSFESTGCATIHSL